MNLFETTLNLLFPPKCPFCGKVLDAPAVCPSCDKSLPWTKDAETERTLTGGVRVAAPLWYEAAAREGLLRLKFHGSAAAAGPLGEIVARCAAERFGGEFDTVTWVPVSRKRLKKRGYDQVKLLVAGVCKTWSVKPVRLLVKPVENAPQSGLTDPAARRANVLGVYEAAGDAEGKRILLVDDICTTGATFAECARVLKDAGAAEVLCVAAAFARQRKDSGKVHKSQGEWG